MEVSGSDTNEYKSIKRNFATLIDNLGETVNPALLAEKLQETDPPLIGNGNHSYSMHVLQFVLANFTSTYKRIDACNYNLVESDRGI